MRRVSWASTRSVSRSRGFSAASRIQLATYSFGRPIGTASPESATFQLASYENRNDVTGTVTRNPIAQPPQRYQATDFPKVDRTLKGDRLVKLPPEPAAPANTAPANEDPSTSNASVVAFASARRSFSYAPALSGGLR